MKLRGKLVTWEKMSKLVNVSEYQVDDRNYECLNIPWIIIFF